MSIRTVRRAVIRPGAKGVPGPGGDDHYIWVDKVEDQFDEVIVDLELHSGRTYANIATADADAIWDWGTLRTTTYTAFLNDGTEIYAKPGDTGFTARADATAATNVSYATIGLANADTATWAFPVPANEVYRSYLNDGTEIQALPGAGAFSVVPIDDPRLGQLPTYAAVANADTDTATWAFPVPTGVSYRAMLTDGTELLALPGTSAFTAVPTALVSEKTYATTVLADADTYWTFPVPAGATYQAFLDDGTELRASPTDTGFSAITPFVPTVGDKTYATIALADADTLYTFPVAAGLTYHAWLNDGTELQAKPTDTGFSLVTVPPIVGDKTYATVVAADADTDYTFPVPAGITYHAWLDDGTELSASPTDTGFAPVTTPETPGDKTYASIALADADAFWTFPVPALTTYVAWLDDGTQISAGPAATGFAAVDVDPVGEKSYATIPLANADAYWTWPVPAGTHYEAFLDDGTELHANPGAASFTIIAATLELWIEVPGDQATLDANKQHHLADALAVAAPAVVTGGWFAVRSRGPGGSTVTGVTSGAIPGDGTVVYYVESAGAWERLPSPSSGSADPYQEVLDTAARLAVTGMVEGDVVKETSTGDVYKWDGAAWQLIGKTIITDPNWAPATAYAAGDIVLSAVPVGTATAGTPGDIARWERVAPGTSDAGGASGAMPLAEETSWTYLGSAADTYASLNDVNMAGINDGDSVYWNAATSTWLPGAAERFWGSVDTFGLVLGLTGATIGDEVYVEETRQILKLRSPDGIVAADPTNGGHWFLTGEQTNPTTWDATTATFDDTTFTFDVA